MYGRVTILACNASTRCECQNLLETRDLTLLSPAPGNLSATRTISLLSNQSALYSIYITPERTVVIKIELKSQHF